MDTSTMALPDAWAWTLPFVWLGVIVLAAVIEAMTTQLVSIWFAAGGVAGLITTVAGGPFWLQLLLFAVVTAITLAIARPLARRMAAAPKTETNADRYAGKTGVVTEQIDNVAARGLVKVLGSVWTARSADGSVIPAGTEVIIQSIEGVKAIVRRP